MKICLVSREYPPETGWGGIGTYTYNLAHGLIDLGHEVHVVSCAHEEPEERDYRDKKVYVYRIKEKRIPFLSRFSLVRAMLYRLRIRQKINELIDEFGVEIVEYPNYVAEGFLLVFGRRRVPLVCRIHTPMFAQLGPSDAKMGFRYKFLYWMEKISIFRADIIVPSTRFYAEEISRLHKMSLNDIPVIPLGVQLPAEEELNLEPNNKFIEVLYVGRLEKRKGTKYLLEAIPKILDECPQARFTLIGKDIDKYYQRYFERTTGNKYENHVRFLEWMRADQLKRHYRDCDIFVAPSLDEPFGLVFLEAMSCGKPVVACDVCGVKEIVEDEKNGILVKSRSGSEIVKAMMLLISDKSKRLAMARHGRELCEKKFSRDSMSLNMQDLYLSMQHES